MLKAAHKMRLRSRASTANNPESSSIDAAPSERSVLADVSNRKRENEVSAGGNDTKKPKVLKRLSSALNPFESGRAKETADPEKNSDADEDERGVENGNGGQRRSRRVKLSRTSLRGKRKNDDPVADERKSKIGRMTTSQDPLPVGDCDVREAANEEVPTIKEMDYSLPKEDRIVPRIFCMRRDTFDGKNHTLGVAPHDEEDVDNVLQCTDYVSDLFQHLYASETTSCPSMYMANQRDINAKMRAILVDWLVEVHMKFRLVPDTLYLCVNIIDRYCSIVPVPRNKLQLVGVTALLIACKYEEIYPPEVRDCVYITDRAYQREEVLAMEQDMLGKLHYKISVPTAYPFILRFLQLAKASPLTRAAANYYMERTLQEHDLLRFRPSLVSAAAVLLALNNPDILVKENSDPSLTNKNALSTKLLIEFTGFKLDAMKECAAIIAQKVDEEPVTASRRQLVSVKRKYDQRRFHHVSSIVELPSAYFLKHFTDGTASERL